MNPFVRDDFVLPVVSLNKLRIGDLDKIKLPADVQDKTGMDLVSGAFFVSEVDKLLEELDISGTPQLRHQIFMQLINSSDERLNKKSEQVIEKLARNLAYLLIALKIPNAKNQQLRPEWTKDHWGFWQRIENIYLSGGLTLGIIGHRLKTLTESFFKEMDIFPFHLHLVEDSEYLPIIGAYNKGARCSGHMLLFDFGHTYVKRAYAVNKDIYIMNAIDAPLKMEESYGEQERGNAILLHDFIIQTIADSFYEAEKKGCITSHAFISIANYIYKGQIYLNRGVYGKLRLLNEYYQNFLAKDLSRKLGREIFVELIHDATAAAVAISAPKSAVITLGTGLGVGFCNTQALAEHILHKPL